MIKFFRKIRQNLLSERKTGKYLKYAIGEIILVVIGILIALYINNWNEKRLSKEQTKTYLKNLDTEINQNIQLIEGIGKNIKRLADISHHYHSKLYDRTTEVPDSVITNFVLKINPIITFNPSQTVLKDFLGSGHLKDITGDELKNDILFLESRYESYNNELRELNNQYNNHIQPYLMLYGDYTKLIDSVYGYKIIKAEFGHKRDAFVNNKTLSNQLVWYIAFLAEANNGTTVTTNESLTKLSNRIKSYLDD